MQTKVPQISKFLRDQEIDIMIITETWLNFQLTHEELRGYQIIQSPFNRHQGVLILLSNKFENA
jgi:hypothetical protein